jgi:outer membrane receptor protein involved in Fe transport
LKQGFDSQGVVWDWRGDEREFKGVFSHSSDNNKLVYGRNQHETTDADRYLARFFYKQALSDRHALSMGLSLEDIAYKMDFNAKLVSCNDLDPGCSTVDAQYISYKDTLDVFTHELFLEDKWSLTDRQALTLGFNYANDDYIGGGRIEPRLRFDYQLSERLSTYLAAGQYSQLPQLREMIDVLGNPDLSTVKADHYVLGMTQALGSSWRWNADLYYKTMRDVVISAEQDSAAQNYSNGARGRAYGAEFLLRKELTDRWYGWASLSLSESDRTKTATGERVNFEYDKPILLNLVANRLVGKRWMMGLRWSYQSGARYTPIIGLLPSSSHAGVSEPVYGMLNSQRLPAYHRLDLRAEYTSPKKWGYWKFYVDVLNAYNHKSVASYDYAPSGRKLVATPPGYGADVPVSKTTTDGLFPSIGFEVKIK